VGVKLTDNQSEALSLTPTGKTGMIQIPLIKRLFRSTVVLLILPVAVFADESLIRSRDINVIDIPTAEVVDHYAYNVSFRFGRDGNLQTKPLFGVFPRLNLGFGLDGENVIGRGNSRLNRPTLNVKFRLFDGKRALPALAIGYDGQGYVWNKHLDEYEQREKGLYLVGSSEIGVPDLNLHLGVNHFDFDHGDSTRGFFGLTYTYEQLVGLMAEWDHATDWKERRINFGLKYYVTPLFTVDLIGRNIPKAPESEARETERIVRLVYTGSF
jgi:hypothetical protein